jgi:cation diffusion facilitator CzcD-associated flavoprotein CzcO
VITNLIIGAGASGLFLASLLKKDYLILEHNN